MSGDNLPAWRKALQPASFRGKPFSVKRSDAQVGRRTVVHNYPQRDEAFPEDMGRLPRAFTIEALVIGPDYMKARDALIDALEQPGPGQLVHPYYGRRMVSLTAPARISESYEFGGSARISLDFILAGVNAQPSARPDTKAQVASSAAKAKKSIAAEFAKAFSLTRMPEFVSRAGLEVARDVMSALDGVRRDIVPDLSVISEYVSAAQGVSKSLGDLIGVPSSLAGQLLGLMSGISGLGRSPLAAFTALRSLFGYGSSSYASNRTYGCYGGSLPTVPLTTPARLQQAANQDALTAFIRRAAIIEAAESSSAITFDSYQQATLIRDELAERLDDEAAGVPLGTLGAGASIVSDAVYDALTELRVAVVRDISSRGADLARVSTVELPATLPALVAAYKIYGDATRADELVSRNRSLIRHPGFVPGGQSLEILVE